MKAFFSIILFFISFVSAVFILSGCSGSGGEETKPVYQGNYLDAGQYTIGYTESVLQVAQEAADIIELLSIHPGSIVTSTCSNNGNIDVYLDDADQNGRASKGDEISITYNKCYRDSIQESISGNILISVAENLDNQQYKLQISFESLNLIVTELDSLTISGMLLLDYLNDGHTHSLDVSPGAKSFQLAVSDESLSIAESIVDYRITKTINLDARQVEVYSKGEIQSPIFSSPITFSTRNNFSGVVDSYPSDLFIEFSSEGYFQGSVTTDAWDLIVTELNTDGEPLTHESFDWRSIIEGFLWKSPLDDNEYPTRYLEASHISGKWRDEELVESEESYDAIIPKFTLGKNKNMFAVWQQTDGTRTNVFGNRYIYGEGWESARLLESLDEGNAILPRIVADKDGNAIVVWAQHDGSRFNIWSNQYIDGIGWQTAELHETDDTLDARNPEIGIDSVGNAIVVWEVSDSDSYKIYGKRYLKEGGWQTEQVIANESGWAAAFPKISINDSGSALVAWRIARETNSSPLSLSLMGTYYSIETGWGTPEFLEITHDGSALNHSVILDNQGNGFAVWSQKNGSIRNIMYNRFVLTSGWQGAELLENDNYGNADRPFITFNQSMKATVVWDQVMSVSGATRSQVLMSTYDQENGWSSFERISDQYDDVYLPIISFDTKGNAIAQWYDNEAGGRNLEYKRFSGNSWSNTETLVEDVQRMNSETPLFTMLSSGEAAAMWVKESGSTSHIYSSIFE